MLKRFLQILIFFAMTLNIALADEVFKITSVNFDDSNSMVLLTSPDNTQEPILKQVKLVKLSNPNRAYFDISSAILTMPQQNWHFDYGDLKQIKVGQFSTEPNVVRVVMYYQDGANPSKTKILKLNNNIIIQFDEPKFLDTYFQNTYRDQRASGNDYYEYLTVSDSEILKQTAKNNLNDEKLSQIQQAFNSDISKATTQSEVKKKEFKLRTKYYLDKVSIKDNALLLNGFGSITIEKPMFLTNPSRAVFDIANAYVNPEIRNKEFKINMTDTVKIGQFETNKARIVICSNTMDKYIPIFSQDNQSLLFTQDNTFDITKLYTKTSDGIGYFYRPINNLTGEFIMAFSSPVVHSIKRENSNLIIYLYNVSRYSETLLRQNIAGTLMNDLTIELMPKVGLKLILPLKQGTSVDTFLGADARAIKIVMKNSKLFPVTKKKKASGKTVVLDAGHGGSDCGAIRNGINEKDITLDVTKRVADILSAKGYNVELTRGNDLFVSLQDRVDFSEKKGADVFVSIHVNASTKPEISGIETHYWRQESLDLAQIIHAQMISNIKTNDRGLFKSKFYVINHTTSPAILVEIGFLSNNEERDNLLGNKRKQQTAKAIAQGIMDYLK